MSKETVSKLTIIAILGVGLGYFTATSLLPQSWLVPKSTTLRTQRMVEEVDRPGKVAVNFESEKANVSQPVKANISIDTQGKAINGFDIILQFDPQSWQVASPQVEINPEAPFATYPLNKVDWQAGVIEVSGLTEIEKEFSGETVIGSLLLTPLKAGSLELNVVFDQAGEGSDSNLAEAKTGNDILGKVVHGKINVE